jgi:predicted transcriptional regulator
VIKLDLNAEILLKYFRENKSQREISKELGISRTTVQKYIKEFQSKNERLQELTKDDERNRAEILLLIEEMVSKPKYDTSNRKKVELTDEVMKQIDKLVLQNERNKQLGRTKQLMKKVDAYSGLFGQYFREYPDNKTGYIRTPCRIFFI